MEYLNDMISTNVLYFTYNAHNLLYNCTKHIKIERESSQSVQTRHDLLFSIKTDQCFHNFWK